MKKNLSREKQNKPTKNTENFTKYQTNSSIPSSNNLTSRSARTLSSFNFWSMALLRAMAALSSPLKVQPILAEGLDC